MQSAKKFRIADLKPLFPVLTLLLIGIGMRVLGAWSTANSASSDHSVACLMAKHIAEGQGFPAFYYGQAYMGSLEPAVSAVVCFILGVSGLAVNLGTAFLGVLLLFVIYAWGKGAAGRTAGIAALAYAVIGSPSYFQFMSWSYGGYAAIVFLSALLVWSAAWIRQYDVGKVYIQSGSFLLVGLVAGLGWWTSQLIIPAGVTAVILLSPLCRRRHFAARLMVSISGFVLGSLPFWVWNFRNDWATVRHFAATARGGDYFVGLKHVVNEVLFGLTGFLDVGGRFAPLAYWLRFSIPVIVVFFIYIVVKATRAEDSERRTPYLYGALLLLVALPLVAASSSRYSTQLANRYLLPAYPAMAVMVGVVTAWLAKRWRYGLGWLPLAALIAIQATSLPTYLGWRKSDAQVLGQMEQFSAFLNKGGPRIVFIPYAASGGANYSLNFLLNEQFTFPVPDDERYLPYAVVGEISDGVGVLNNHDNVMGFLELSGGSAQYGGVSGFSVHHGFEPPSRAWREIAPERWASATDSEGEDALSTIADGNMSSRWFEPGGDNDERWIDVQFEAPVQLAGLRITSRAGHYPLTWGVDVSFNDGEPLRVVEDAPSTPWYWSGSRPYWGGATYRSEARFDPLKASGVRIYVEGDSAEIAELQLFQAGEEGDLRSLVALSGALVSNDIKAVYCDRWMANRLLGELEGLIAVSLEPSIFRDQSFVLPMKVKLDASTALVVRDTDAALARRVLALHGIEMNETQIGQWILFHFTSGKWREEYASVDRLVWRGYSCLGDGLEGRFLDDPALDADASFANGAHFMGMTVSPREVSPGQSVDVSLFWTCSAKATPETLSVFAHFKKDGETVFQDDHHFLQHADREARDEFVEIHRLSVPDDAPAGEYDIEVGLYDRNPPHKRVRVSSASATDDRSVRISNVLSVAAHP